MHLREGMMKALIFSLFFISINQGVFANEERVCRFDTTSHNEYYKIGWIVRDNISKAINGWLKEKEILIYMEVVSSPYITQRFDYDLAYNYPQTYLRPIFSMRTDKDQILQSSRDLNYNFTGSSEYKIRYSLVTIRDNQGIPLKKVCRIIAQEDINLNIYNATQGVYLDGINLYKEGGLIYEFEDKPQSSSSDFEVEEMD